MDSEVSPWPAVEKCCDCECICSLINDAHSGVWLRSVKRKFDEFKDDNGTLLPGIDSSSVARVGIENECDALREMVRKQQQSIQDLYSELEEERNAASSAANEAMSMILRLQREKAEVQMEARQFKCFVEEKMAHDHNEICVLQDLLYKREQAIQSLTCEVHAYKYRLMSYGLTEAEADGDCGKGDNLLSQNLSENFDATLELPAFDYPPLKCYNNRLVTSEVDNEAVDVEIHAFGETPHDPQNLKSLEYLICELEGTPKNSDFNGDFNGAENSSLEKVIVNHCPRQTRHSRKASNSSSSSLMGCARDMGPDIPTESPRLGSSFKKADYVSHTEDSHSNLRKPDNVSESGEDASDRVYTIDSIHSAIPNNTVLDTKGSFGMGEDYVTMPKSPPNKVDVEDPYIQNLYTRLQMLEADRESMKRALISMSTDKAQLVLFREIAQQLCKEVAPQRMMVGKKAPVLRSFSVMVVFKWILSFVFWRKRAHRSKYTFGLSENNVGLLMLLEKGSRVRRWRCLTRSQV